MDDECVDDFFNNAANSVGSQNAGPKVTSDSVGADPEEVDSDDTDTSFMEEDNTAWLDDESAGDDEKRIREELNSRLAPNKWPDVKPVDEKYEFIDENADTSEDDDNGVLDFPCFSMIITLKGFLLGDDISELVQDHLQHCTKYDRFMNSEFISLNGSKGLVTLWAGKNESDRVITESQMNSCINDDPFMMKGLVESFEILELSPPPDLNNKYPEKPERLSYEEIAEMKRDEPEMYQQYEMFMEEFGSLLEPGDLT